MFTSVVVLAIILGIGAASNDDIASGPVKLRYYENSIKNYVELNLDEAEKIFDGSWFDPNKTTVMFTHGFGGHPEGPAITGVIKAYLAEEKYNVALLNWESRAGMALPSLLHSYLNWAVPNAIQLGADFSETLIKLSSFGLDLNKTHFIGHSLGAHVFGITGNRIAEKGIQLPWITGLDPATGFDMKPAFMRLNPDSALFTDVIHSDPNKYGSKRELGLVNFWPNFRAYGSVLQPGCPGGNPPIFSAEDFCSHNRSWQLYIDAMKNPGTILSSYAKNFRIWKKYSEADRNRVVLEVGVFDPNALPGNYFFITKDKAPYGLGKGGL